MLGIANCVDPRRVDRRDTTNVRKSDVFSYKNHVTTTKTLVYQDAIVAGMSNYSQQKILVPRILPIRPWARSVL